MIKTYKPSPIKPVTSEMWGPVSLTDWKLDGDSIIETQFEYTAKINALLDRAVPGMNMISGTNVSDDKAFLNYQVLPTLANYGTVTINPAGSLLILEKDSIKGNAALTETNIVAYNAIASLINQQRTDLELTSSVRHAKDTNYPIIPIYMRAMMYNSQTLVKPALHIKSMFGYLQSLIKVNNKAAIRVTQILNKFKQNKFVKPYNEYLELLSVTPLHSETVNSMIDFFHIEKLNDAFNTSYDYVIFTNTIDNYQHEKFDIEGVFNIQKRQGTTPVGPVINLLLKSSLSEPSYFHGRSYLKDLLMLMFADDDTFMKALDDYVDKYLINNLISTINKTISMVSSLPTMFQPFYAALPFLSEYIDTSIFAVKNFVDLEINIRRSSYYSKGNVMTNVELTTSSSNSLYPTWSMQVPLYNGSLKPSAPFNSNGLLYFSSDNQAFIQANALGSQAKIAAERAKQLPECTYVPFVDLSNMTLMSVTIASNKAIIIDDMFDDVTEEFSITNLKGLSVDNFDLAISTVEIDNVAGAISIPVLPSYLAGVTSYRHVLRNKLSAFINWVVFKSDHALINSKDKKIENIVISSPMLTGYRQVEITPVADIVRKATPKLLGFKKALSV